MSEINPKAVDAATAAYNMAEPYVPKMVKDGAAYAVNTATPYVPNLAISAATYAINTATTVVEAGVNTATATRDFAANKVSQTVDGIKVAVNGATTTITAYTPSPVVSLIQSTIEGTKALRSDPVATVKEYIPTFVINVGDKTYEIASHTFEAAKDGVSKTTGFIVTKVNGTVDAITHIPQIHALIEQIQKLTAPVVNRLTAAKKDVPEPVADLEPVPAAQ